MNSFSSVPLAVLLTIGGAGMASATVNKTWVSSAGADSGTCQLASPCRTFAYAISQTSPGGEIDVKDSGAFGGFTINQPISIVADGVVASVGLQPGTQAGITITAGSSAQVALHGLTVNTHDTTTNDIVIENGSRVVLDHMVIQGAQSGVLLDSASFLMVSNSLISNNTFGGLGQSSFRIGVQNAPYYIDNNVITLNEYGLIGNYSSYGNNAINGNTTADLFSNSTVSHATPQ